MLQNKLPIWSCHKGDLVFPHISPKWIRPAVSIPLCWNTKFAVGTRAPKPGSWRSCLHPLFLIGEPGWQYTWNLVHMEQWPTWLIDGCWFFASTKKWSSRLSEVTSSIVDEAYTIQPFISFHWHLQEWLLMIRRQLDDERNLHIQQETRPQTVKKIMLEWSYPREFLLLWLSAGVYIWGKGFRSSPKCSDQSKSSVSYNYPICSMTYFPIFIPKMDWERINVPETSHV